MFPRAAEAEGAATTSTNVSLAETIWVTSWPASLIEENAWPPPRRSRPVMVTRVPPWPALGETASILPGDRYEKPS